MVLEVTGPIYEIHKVKIYMDVHNYSMTQYKIKSNKEHGLITNQQQLSQVHRLQVLMKVEKLSQELTSHLKITYHQVIIHKLKKEQQPLLKNMVYIQLDHLLLLVELNIQMNLLKKQQISLDLNMVYYIQLAGQLVMVAYQDLLDHMIISLLIDQHIIV